MLSEGSGLLMELAQLIDHADFQPMFANLNPTTSNRLSKLRKNVRMTPRLCAPAIILRWYAVG
jgi:hypothetical protein